ncbi:MAG: hypothetical protein R8K46_06065 [Mariprofundaceae bacterium]
MLSYSYFDYRWSWIKPVRNRGEDPVSRCSFNINRLPLRTVSEDGHVQLPYAVHRNVDETLYDAVAQLLQYMEKYLVRGERVSAHHLPATDKVSRALLAHLRETNPQLPGALLHHWCADPYAGRGLVDVLEGVWNQSWKQEKDDRAPWVAAVNTLLVKLLRQRIGEASSEYPELADRILITVLGGCYFWCLQNFLKKHVDGDLEVTRISTYEHMIIPVTPLAFLYRQAEDALLADSRPAMLAYGLEPDLVPRMMAMRERLGSGKEAGMLALIGKDRMGNHLIKRSWTRLCLLELAENCGRGDWMQWVDDPKKLDQFINDPAKNAEALSAALSKQENHVFVRWFAKIIAGGKIAIKAGQPWLYDSRTVMAFRAFDEDIHLEITRRRMENFWLNRRQDLVGRIHGSEADQLMEAAYEEGKLIYLQAEGKRPLHLGKVVSVKIGSLRVDWADYLAAASEYMNESFESFVQDSFLTGVLHVLDMDEEVYLDDFSASGCSLRGPIPQLVSMAVQLRSTLKEMYSQTDYVHGQDISLVAMCLSLSNQWWHTSRKHPRFGDCRLIFSQALAQSSDGVVHESALGRLMHARGKRDGLRPYGKVRIRPLNINKSTSVQALYNAGLAISAEALAEWTRALGGEASVKEYNIPAHKASAQLSGFQLPQNDLNVILIKYHRGGGSAANIVIRIGTVILAGELVGMFEVLDSDSDFAMAILKDGVPNWR